MKASSDVHDNRIEAGIPELFTTQLSIVISNNFIPDIFLIC